MAGKTGKKFMSVILTLALVLSLLPAMTLTASAKEPSITINCISGVEKRVNAQEIFDTTLNYQCYIGFTFNGENPGLYFNSVKVGTTSAEAIPNEPVTDEYDNVRDLVFTSTTNFEVTVRIYDAANDYLETTTLTFITSAANTAPTVDAVTPATVSYVDTAADDVFNNAAGTISATDGDGSIASYGVSGGTTGGSDTIDETVYDVSKTGTYGELYVKSDTGEYAYVPNDAEINAVSVNKSETFTVTATDNLGASGTATLTINITGANDAPTMGTNTGITVAEGSADTVIAKANLEVTDVDTAAASITYTLSAVPANGTLKKSGGALAQDNTFTQADINSGIITYTHDGTETASDGFSFTVSDGAGGSIGATNFYITVTPVNDAPVLENSGTMTLTSITEDDDNPVGNTVASVIGDSITDADPAAVEGIAIVGLSGNGTWQYHTGSGWAAVGEVLNSSALLLKDTSSLRFIPDASFQNAQSANITFRAWDQTSGTQGTKVDTTTNGGTTAFSTATATASVAVTGINDDPAILGLPAVVTVAENSASNVDLSAATLSDPDSAANSVTLTLSVGSGALSANTEIPGVTVGGSETALTLSGTVSAIDTYLNTASNIKYTGAVGTYGDNAATLTLTANDGGYTGAGGGGNVTLGTVDINITAIAPTVTNVTATNEDGPYGLGQTIDITVEFSHVVVVTGTPQLTLETGAVDRTASYTDGSGSNTLTFRYTTQAGDETSDLNYKDINALTLNSGAITRGTTNAVLTLPATTGAGSLSTNKNISIAAYPTVTLSVGSASVAEDGGTSTITVTLSEISSQDVLVSIAYSGTATRGTDYNGTASMTITIPAGSLSASAATGIAAIQDTEIEGNETILINIDGVSKVFEDGEQQQTITILDDDIPTVTGVSSSTADGSYKAGDVISIQVAFSAAVTVTGTPQLLLETGTADRTINYISGSGDILTFIYTVQSGDNSTDLDYVGTNSLTLNGGTITSSGINANLVLPTPGAAGSLRANKAIVVDTTAPTAPSVPDLAAGSDSGFSSTDNITTDTTPTIMGTAEAGSTVTLYGTDGTTVIGSTEADGSGNWSITAAALSSGVHTITAKATDAVGNTSVASLGLSLTIDATAPDAPTIFTPPQTVNADSITISGTAEAGATITITDGAATADGTADGSGSYSISVALTQNSVNTLVVKATDAAGNNSATASVAITEDSTAPGSPMISTSAETINADSITISGTAEAGTTITITGGAATATGTADGSGNYSINVTLTQDSVNTFIVKATDAAGNNSVAASVAITEDSTAPSAPMISTLAQTVNADSITISGGAEAGAAITVTGGAVTATGAADGSGNYSINVTLTQDSVNMLIIKATDAVGNESTAASVAITEDSAEPSAPVISTSAQTINADSIIISGTTEAGVTITITGGAATATGTADGSGNYSLSVALTQNSVNTLIVKATDTAGNHSATASVAITEDSVVPIISAPTISVGNLTYNSAKLTWTKSTDDRTLGAALQYKVVYSTSNITTVAVADALAGTWTTDIATATVTGLTESTDYYFNVLVKDQAGNMALYSSATGKTPATPVSDDNSSAPSTPSSNAVVEVNGEKQNAGQTSTKTTGGQTVTTITVDDAKLDKILEQKGSHATVTLPASGNPDAVIGQLTGQTVKSMEQKEAVLEIKTETATYTLPASQINIDTVSAQLGARIELKDIKVNVKIAEPSAATIKTVEDTANRGNYQLVVKPIEFEISCTSGSGTVEVSRFNGYVERTVALPTGVDPSKITTGIVLNADGTFSHVPTRVIVSNGKYYAKINSLTNSTYSVIYNPVTFPDVASHWAKDAVNDMGSRLVVTGVGGGIYEPERSITRAEFATIVVRAMGLKTGITESAFADVSLTDWFNGYVDTATSYGLINGYDSMSYGPNDTITREQAMTILARAMKLTGLSVTLTDSEASSILANYTDADLVSDYAKASVAACIKTGIVSGTTSSTLSPKDSVTRAEVAVMVQTLLKKS